MSRAPRWPRDRKHRSPAEQEARRAWFAQQRQAIDREHDEDERAAAFYDCHHRPLSSAQADLPLAHRDDYSDPR